MLLLVVLLPTGREGLVNLLLLVGLLPTGGKGLLELLLLADLLRKRTELLVCKKGNDRS